MAKPIENLKDIRLEKLEKIRRLGIDPYPAKTIRKDDLASARQKIGEKVSVAGRIMAIRGHGGIQFLDLLDETGKIQLVFKQEDLDKTGNELLPLLDLGDFIDASGKVFKTNAGEISIQVEAFNLLAKSLRPLPSHWYGLKDVEERFRQRYLDLIMNPEIKDLFVKKSKFWSAVRQYLLKEGFLEVETPVLEVVPGGADARPFVTHHWALDTDFYLRISLELHLKRLVVGGFEKVFEVGRIFRNEGIDAEHLQDYTQMEFYWAYNDYQGLMDFLEKFYRYVVTETTGGLVTNRDGQKIDWGKKWERIDFVEIFKEKVGLSLLEATKEELWEKAESLGLKPEKFLGEGRLVDLIYKKVIRPTITGPAFLINLPVEISPLAKRQPDKPKLTQRLLVMAGGTELGNGFSELNDPVDQKNRFLAQQKLRDAGDQEAQMYDEDFIRALEYGMPPTAGFGWSERLFAFLMDKPIREVVFFPPMKPEA